MSTDDLTPDQMTAITRLISGASYTEAAEAAGVNTSTLRRWRRNFPSFVQELRERKKEILSQTTSKVSDEADRSLDTIIEIRDDVAEESKLRLRAAMKLVDLALQVGEIEILQAEIEDLKARLDAMGK